MKLKAFIAGLTGSIFLLFPYNIIGCAGGDADPFDYFVSFFHPEVSGDPDNKAFVYTDYRFLYDASDEPNIATVTSAEWSAYYDNKFTNAEAFQFVCEYGLKDINSLYYHIEKKQAMKLPDSVKKNGMTQFFLDRKDLEALGYLIYAKKVEPYVVGGWNSWGMPERDTTKMVGLIKNGLQLHNAAKSDFIKLRYAYQVVRLAHYTERYNDCIRWYEELIMPNKTNSVIQELGLSLKAGALKHLGKKHEAAYLFSQLFMKNKAKKISNYKSFDFSIDQYNEDDLKKTLAFAKSDIEKANVLAVFNIGNSKSSMASLKQIMALDPQSIILPALVTREINKLEEQVLTPYLRQSINKEDRFVGYVEIDTKSSQYAAWKAECTELSKFCSNRATFSGKRGFYFIAGAYSSLIAGDLATARQLLDKARNQSLNAIEKDQWQLTQLLWAINSKQTIDAQFEKELMPSINWMELKAKADPVFAKFFRRLFADMLAMKYKTANNEQSVKYILCSGVADRINDSYVKESYGYYPQTLFKLRKFVSAQQVEALIRLVESKNLNPFEQYLVQHSSFNKDDLNDIAGTAWLRQYQFIEAEKWFKKIPAAYYKKEPFKSYLAANPFADLLLDTHRPTKQDTVTYTKLSFAQKMSRLEKDAAAATDKEQKAKLFYELAKGYYHMSYWGNSWLLVEYDWSGSETGYDNKDSSSFGNAPNPDYYLVNKSKDYYLLAASNSSNQNFKAKCIYMAAKCEQKKYGEMPYYYENSPEYRKKVLDWANYFNKNTNYYTLLQKQYGNTAFYKEAYNTCSYLKDFVNSRK